MKRFWLNLHRWVGLKLFVLLSFVLITGTLATISHEIDWLIDPARRVAPAKAPENQDWDGLLRTARDARPSWAIQWVSAPLDRWHAAEIVAVTPEGERKRLLIHPATLDLQGERGWFNAQRLFRDAHRRLMIPNVWGIVIVSSLSFLILLSLVSGLFLYKKFWRGFFKMPRTRDARTFWGDMHRLGGVWSIWFIAVMALTGLWYLTEALGRFVDQDVGAFPELAPPPALVSAQATKSGLSYNLLAERAGRAIDDFRVTTVYPAGFADGSIRLQGHGRTILVRPRANMVSFDAQTGEMTSVVRGHTLSVMQRVSEMADPLHFGTFGGFATKLLYFVFGLILSGLSLSGVYIYSKRIRRAQQRQIERDAKTGVYPQGSVA